MLSKTAWQGKVCIKFGKIRWGLRDIETSRSRLHWSCNGTRDTERRGIKRESSRVMHERSRDMQE